MNQRQPDGRKRQSRTGTTYAKARAAAEKLKATEISAILYQWHCTDIKARKGAVSANADVMAARQERDGKTASSY